MPPPRVYRSEALTLRKMPLGEADLIVTFFTRENGKLQAVAKGARKNSSKLVGHLGAPYPGQPFSGPRQKPGHRNPGSGGDQLPPVEGPSGRHNQGVYIWPSWWMASGRSPNPTLPSTNWRWIPCTTSPETLIRTFPCVISSFACCRLPD